MVIHRLRIRTLDFRLYGVACFPDDDKVSDYFCMIGFVAEDVVAIDIKLAKQLVREFMSIRHTCGLHNPSYCTTFSSQFLLCSTQPIETSKPRTRCECKAELRLVFLQVLTKKGRLIDKYMQKRYDAQNQ